MGDRTRGLYDKFNVDRIDGTDSRGEKHEECWGLREIKSGETYTVDTWSIGEGGWARERLWDVAGRLVFDRRYWAGDRVRETAPND